MKKFIALGLAVLGVAGLVSCNNTPKGPTAEEVLAGFNPNLTTLTATYVQDYQLIVNSDNKSFKAFEEDVNETTAVELDLTAGDLYLYAKNGEKEVLLVKDGSAYKYVTTDMLDYVTVADDAAAKAKIDELLKEVTFRKAGWLTLDSLTYDVEEYAHREFLLSTLNIPAEDVETPTMTVTEEKGLSAAYTLEYVCFTGDSGIFELKEATAGANTATVVTDATGLVKSSTVTFNAHTSLALTQDGVPLDLIGTRTLNVNHGATVTKKTEINHVTEAKKVAVTVKESTNGTYTVSWFDYAKGDFTMHPVTNGDEVAVGMWLGIRVTAAEGYKVGQVKVNGATTQVVVNGIYCFEVKDTAQTTEVEFISESEELVTDATVIFEQPQNGTLKVTYLDFNNGGAAAPQTELQSGDKFAVDKTSYWLCFAVTANEGYELDKILVNGQEASNYGAWLYSIKAAGEYTVVVTFKSTAPEQGGNQGGQQGAPTSMKYTGNFGGFVNFEFTFDLATNTGTFTLGNNPTDTFDFTNAQGVITITNFTSSVLVVKSASISADFQTLTVVASYNGGADATMTGTYTK